MSQRNGTNAQAFNIYNTYTDGSNYERGIMAWNANALFIGTEKDGTGSNRDLYLRATGNVRVQSTGNNSLIFRNSTDSLNLWDVSGTGVMTMRGNQLFGTDNAFDIGANGVNRPRTGYFGTSIMAPQFRGALGARLVEQANGIWQLGNSSNTDFARLQFGGTSGSFPSIKRSATILQARLADDSAFATFQGKLQTDANAATETIVPDKTLTLYAQPGRLTKCRVLPLNL